MFKEEKHFTNEGKTKTALTVRGESVKSAIRYTTGFVSEGIRIFKTEAKTKPTIIYILELPLS